MSPMPPFWIGFVVGIVSYISAYELIQNMSIVWGPLL